jgi:hypothetical protein
VKRSETHEPFATVTLVAKDPTLRSARSDLKAEPVPVAIATRFIEPRYPFDRKWHVETPSGTPAVARRVITVILDLKRTTGNRKNVVGYELF